MCLLRVFFGFSRTGFLAFGTPGKPGQVPDGLAEFDRIHPGTFTGDPDHLQTHRIGWRLTATGPESSADA